MWKEQIMIAANLFAADLTVVLHPLTKEEQENGETINVI